MTMETTIKRSKKWNLWMIRARPVTYCPGIVHRVKPVSLEELGWPSDAPEAKKAEKKKKSLRWLLALQQSR
ncbi:hypothetical protein HA466_0191430 [Hirschfeldia incana]|nr:hypothetical protein HA466_0191430 [Hirschfeldia incana]